MKADRITRVNELIRRELGVQLYRVVDGRDFDHSAVTFTHALTSVDLRSCRVLVSIRGTPAKQEHLLGILRKHRVEFQAAIHEHVILRYTPQLHFVLDHSVEEGDQVLALLNRMEANGEVEPDAGADALGSEDAADTDVPPA